MLVVCNENHSVGRSVWWNVGVDVHGGVLGGGRRGGSVVGGSVSTSERDVVAELEDDM